MIDIKTAPSLEVLLGTDPADDQSAVLSKHWQKANQEIEQRNRTIAKRNTDNLRRVRFSLD